jgi:hypothetical protein
MYNFTATSQSSSRTAATYLWYIVSIGAGFYVLLHLYKLYPVVISALLPVCLFSIVGVAIFGKERINAWYKSPVTATQVNYNIVSQGIVGTPEIVIATAVIVMMISINGSTMSFQSGNTSSGVANNQVITSNHS